MKKVYVITDNDLNNIHTSNIQSTTIQQIFKTIKAVEVEILNYKEVPKDIANQIPYTDYPATVFVEDGKVRYMFTGTKSEFETKNKLKELKFID